MKISVITPSIRPDGLEVVAAALSKQSFQDWEWVVCGPYKVKLKAMDLWQKYGTEDSGFVLRPLTDPEKKEGDMWTLNQVHNKMLKHSKGELIVTWQDWIWAPEDALEKFWFWHEYYKGKALVTGVGDQYGEVDENGKPTIKVWNDPRKGGSQTNGSHYEIFPQDWEANFAMFPRQAAYDVGGWDEGLDRWYGMDNVSFVQRVDALGKYKFYIDHDLECRGYKHERVVPQKEWDKNHAMFEGRYEKRKQELKEKDLWPKVGYLTT